MKNEDSIIEMRVEGLTLDPLSHVPIILLKDLEGSRVLPIWVGIFEANAIALEMEKVATPRPMTHDLIKSILKRINAEVEHVIINDLRDNTFYAEISFKLNNERMVIDSRPSDAIAVALRMEIPIYVTSTVIVTAKSVEISNLESDSNDSEQWKKWLDNVRPSDFGN